jgi:VanZ family protein
MALIFILSSVPGSPEEGGFKFLTDIDPNLQNFLHVPLFGMLQVLWLNALAKYDMPERKIIIICLAICLAYGGLDELHQMFVPGRYASLTDISLNFTGVVVGTLAFLFWRKKIRSSNLGH